MGKPWNFRGTTASISKRALFAPTPMVTAVLGAPAKDERGLTQKLT
jgi:hypothetical protein